MSSFLQIFLFVTIFKDVGVGRLESMYGWVDEGVTFRSESVVSPGAGIFRQL